MNTETTPSKLASQALAQLAEALQAGKSETLTTYLKVMSRFSKYSWGNCLLISTQRPNASHVVYSTDVNSDSGDVNNHRSEATLTN